tara:strand:- start:914 stop:1093 length:180 start_codon:yes stop_codon:yes gene_type:complete
MKIRVCEGRQIFYDGSLLQGGAAIEVPADAGQALIDGGYAAEVKAPAKKKKAAPKKKAE